MARAFSGVLGSIAMSIAILRGLVCGSMPNEILTQCLVVFFCFAVLGFWIGFLADKTICESVENRFREEMARLQSAAASTNSDHSE
jgi:hypothetical protein